MKSPIVQNFFPKCTRAKKFIMITSPSKLGLSSNILSTIETHSFLCFLVISSFRREKETFVDPRTTEAILDGKVITCSLFLKLQMESLLSTICQFQLEKNQLSRPEVSLSSQGDRTGGDETGKYATLFAPNRTPRFCQRKV